MVLAGNSRVVHMIMGFLQFCAWAVALGGLASIQNDLNSKTGYSLQWFVLFLELALIIALPVLAIMGIIRKVSTAFACYYAITSTLFAYFAYQAYLQVHSNFGSPGLGGVPSSRLNTWIAGCSLLFIFNWIAILLMSLDADSNHELISGANTTGRTATGKSVAGTGTGAGVGTGVGKTGTAAPGGQTPFQGPVAGNNPQAEPVV